MEDAGTIDPTEMSNSPAIIKKPDRQGDDAHLGGDVQPARPARGAHEDRTAQDAKKVNTTTKPISDPVSGRRASAPSEARAAVVCVWDVICWGTPA